MICVDDDKNCEYSEYKNEESDKMVAGVTCSLLYCSQISFIPVLAPPTQATERVEKLTFVKTY